MLVLFLVVAPGCERDGAGTLVIATSWPAAERHELEAGFRAWAVADPAAAVAPLRIAWIAPTEGGDPTVLVGRRPVDLVLGGPAWAYDRLAAGALLEPDGAEDSRPWRVVRRPTPGLAAGRPEGGGPPPAPASWSIAGGAGMAGRVAPGDPRRDPAALACAEERLASGSWAQGYAELVRAAGQARSIGRGADVAAPTPPSIVDPGSGSGWAEGVGLVRGARGAGPARAFLRFLDERVGTGPPPAPEEPLAAALLADLLGATLVDAQDELRAAWAALIRSGRFEAWEERLTEAPPWPPASVTKLLGAEETAAWAETLAEQVAPHVQERAWLVIAWERPPRPLDGRLLDELARAAGGRLAREPRFRAWLRAEWTEWARQRSRWILRAAGEGGP